MALDVFQKDRNIKYLLTIIELIESAMTPLKYNKLNIIDKYPIECIKLIDIGIEFIKYDDPKYITGKLKISSEIKFEHKMKLYDILYHSGDITFNKDEQMLLNIIFKLYKLKNDITYKKYKYYHIQDLIKKFIIYKKYLKPLKSAKKIYKSIIKIYNYLNTDYYGGNEEDFDEDTEYIGNDKFTRTLIKMQNYYSDVYNTYYDFDYELRKKIANKIRSYV